MKNKWQIAQFNIAHAMYPQDDDRMAGFYSQLDDINALAERSKGFVWRLQTETGNATDIVVDDDPMLIVNMSVWESVEALFNFAYKTAHQRVLAKRREWFSRPAGAYQVLWWIVAGHEPSVEEGMARLEYLQSRGADSHAFTFKKNFPPPDREQMSDDMQPDTYCSGWD
jgi:hypothetical protein